MQNEFIVETLFGSLSSSRAAVVAKSTDFLHRIIFPRRNEKVSHQLCRANACIDQNGRRCTRRHSRNFQHNGKELPRRKWAALRLSCLLHQLHDARGIGDSVTHKHLLNLVTEYLLHQLRRDKRQSRWRWRRLASRTPATLQRLCLPFFAFFAASFFSSSSCLTSSSVCTFPVVDWRRPCAGEEAEALCSSVVKVIEDHHERSVVNVERHRHHVLDDTSRRSVDDLLHCVLLNVFLRHQASTAGAEQRIPPQEPALRKSRRTLQRNQTRFLHVRSMAIRNHVQLVTEFISTRESVFRNSGHASQTPCELSTSRTEANLYSWHF